MPRILLVTLSLMALALVLWVPISRASQAREKITTAAARLDAALHAERDVRRLRDALPVASTTGAPRGDIAALVQAAVREAGLPAQAVLEVSPQEGALVGGSSITTSSAKWRRQSVTVRLAPLPLADIGAVLDRLRVTAPAWSSAQIDLRAEPARGAAENPEAVAFTLNCRLACTYLDSPPSPSSPTPASTSP